jgi:hypothetical protein
MELRFDPHQDLQVKAIAAAADLFDGQPRVSARVRFKEGMLRAVLRLATRALKPH